MSFNIQLSSQATAYLVNHVVLPPKLPQADDFDTSHEWSLIDITIQTLQDLKSMVQVDQVGTVTSAIASVENLRGSRDSCGNVAENQLQRLFDGLVNGTVNGSILLEIKAQNAGFEVYIRRQKFLLALKCLIAAHKLDPEQPVLHEQLVRFRQARKWYLLSSV